MAKYLCGESKDTKHEGDGGQCVTQPEKQSLLNYKRHMILSFCLMTLASIHALAFSYLAANKRCQKQFLSKLKSSKIDLLCQMGKGKGVRKARQERRRINTTLL